MNSDNLIEQIAQENSANNFFLLFDTAKNYLFIRRWLKALPQIKLKNIGNLFEGTIDETSPLEVSPLLILITLDTKVEIKKQFMVEENIGMFSVIETPLSKHELIQHLQPFLQAELPNGELALFRFYDPSIVKILDQMLDNENYDLLMKPIKKWWYQDFQGLFHSLLRSK